MWLAACHGSFGLPLYQNLLSSQVVHTLLGYTLLIDRFDAWLQVKYVPSCHGDKLVVSNTNPHAMMILWFLFFLLFCKVWV